MINLISMYIAVSRHNVFLLLKNVNPPENSEEVALALKVLTIVGSILSMVGLLLTILTMLIFKYVYMPMIYLSTMKYYYFYLLHNH